MSMSFYSPLAILPPDHAIDAGLITYSSTASRTLRPDFDTHSFIIGTTLTLHGNSSDSATPLIRVTTPYKFEITTSPTSGLSPIDPPLVFNLATSGKFDVGAGGTLTFSAPIRETGGSYGITKTGSGTLSLAFTNTYSGDTRISAGTLLLAHTSALAQSTLDMNAADAGTFIVGTPVTLRLGGLKGSRAANFGTGSLTVGLNNQSSEFTGQLTAQSFNKVGGGALTLGAKTTLTSAPTISGGTLILNASQPGAPASGILVTTGPLTLFGSSLRIKGANSASVPGIQNFTTLSLTGGTTLGVDSAATGAPSLNFSGAWSRAVGSSLNVSVTGAGGGFVVANDSAIATNPTTGIIGTYATYNGQDWVSKNASKQLVAYSGGYTTANDASALTAASATTHFTTNVGLSGTTPSGATIGSLRLNAAAPSDLEIGDTLNVACGGILVTANVGANNTLIRGGALTSSASELFLHNFSGGAVTLASPITGALSLGVAGGGTVHLAASSNYTGTTSVNAGTVTIKDGGAIGTGPLYISNGAALVIDRADGYTLSNTISGTGGIFVRGGGATFSPSVGGSTGTISVDNSVLHVPAIQSLGALPAIGTDVLFLNNGTLHCTTPPSTGASNRNIVLGAGIDTFVIDAGVVSTQFGALKDNLAGAGDLVKRGGGTLSLRGDNTYTGKTTIAGGTLSITRDTRLGNYPATPRDALFIDGGALYVYDDLQIYSQIIWKNRDIVLGPINGAGTGTIAAEFAATIEGVIKDNVGGVGNLVTGGSGRVELQGANTYSGSTTVAKGQLRLVGGDDRLPTGTSLTLGDGTNAGTFNLGGFNQTVASLNVASGSPGGYITNSASATTNSIFTVNGAGTSTYSGQFGAGTSANALTLVKSGSGTLILSGSNLHTGGTRVIGGTLVVANPNALNSANGGTVSIEQSGQLVIQSGMAGAVKIAGLDLSSPDASVDVGDNDLVLSDIDPTLVAQKVRNARNGGAWNAPGITSTAARNAPNHVQGLGVLSGEEFSEIAGATQFNGSPFAAADALVKYTLNGDADFNDRVDFDDYSRIDNGFNQQTEVSAVIDWFTGDFNYDGRIDFDDYALIDNAFNAQSGTLARAVAYLDGSDRSSGLMGDPSLQFVQSHLEQFGVSYAQSFLAAVPEPSSAAMVAMVLVSVSRHRRRFQSERHFRE